MRLTKRERKKYIFFDQLLIHSSSIYIIKKCVIVYADDIGQIEHKYVDINIDIYNMSKTDIGVDEHGKFMCSTE